MSEDQKARDEAWRAAMRQIAKAYGISEEGFEELGSMDRGLMKRVRELSERRAEKACIKGAVGPQMDRWGVGPRTSRRWYGGSGISAGNSIWRRPGTIQTRQEIRNEIFSTEGRRGRREGRKATPRPGKRY